MMNADEITGELVHIAMRRQKVTQAVLGEALGLTQAALGKKLHGNRSWTLDEVLAASRYLDVPMKDLLPGADYNPVLTGRGRHVEPLVEATADYGSEG